MGRGGADGMRRSLVAHDSVRQMDKSRKRRGGERRVGI